MGRPAAPKERLAVCPANCHASLLPRGPDPPLDGKARTEGPRGKIYGGGHTAPPGLFEAARRGPDPPSLQSFDHAVRTRDDRHGHKPNAEAAHRSCTLVNLAIIAIRIGRKIRYDPVKEQALDDEANRLVDVPMRAPWHL